MVPGEGALPRTNNRVFFPVRPNRALERGTSTCGIHDDSVLKNTEACRLRMAEQHRPSRIALDSNAVSHVGIFFCATIPGPASPAFSPHYDRANPPDVGPRSIR